MEELKPRMSEAELELFTSAIPRGGYALEFGCGGSTPYFFEQGIKTLVSVESDRAWLEKLRATPLLQHFLRKKSWVPLHADIGQTGEWGYPTTQPNLAWLNYHQFLWEHIADKNFDFILVDGRFRVACACQSLLHIARTDIPIMVHDFWDREEAGYHALLQFCNVLDRADTAVILRAKPDLNWRELARLLLSVQFNPS